MPGTLRILGSRVQRHPRTYTRKERNGPLASPVLLAVQPQVHVGAHGLLGSTRDEPGLRPVGERRTRWSASGIAARSKCLRRARKRQPRGARACLGHEAGDSKGQQRCPAVSRALALTSGNAREQQRSWERAVCGMQGFRGSTLGASNLPATSPRVASRGSSALARFRLSTCGVVVRRSAAPRTGGGRRSLHTAEVTGSIPVTPTIYFRRPVGVSRLVIRSTPPARRAWDTPGTCSRRVGAP
jgi:hypothetical protein